MSKRAGMEFKIFTAFCCLMLSACSWVTTGELSAQQRIVENPLVLAEDYFYGQHKVQSYPLAFKWYLKAASQGSLNAQLKVATLFYDGLGTEIDFESAEKWFQLAAEQGNLEAQKIIAKMYFEGKTVSKNLYLAHYWYKQAAFQGDYKAIIALKEITPLLETLRKKEQRVKNRKDFKDFLKMLVMPGFVNR
jgi:hypothetical protein